MKSMHKNQKSHIADICFVSSISYTIYVFYGSLLKQLKNRGVEFGVAATSSPNLCDLRDKYKCNIFPIHIARRIALLKDIAAIFRLTCYFRNQRYRIVHAHTPKGGLVGMMASFFARVPVRVYTIHGLPLETATGLKRRLLWLAEAVSCRFANQILAVSLSLRELVVKERLCSPEKIKVLGDGTACGLDTEKFVLNETNVASGKEIRKELRVSEDEIVVGFVGRLVPDKGIKTLVESFVCLQDQLHDIHLLLVGPVDESRETFDRGLTDTIETNKNIHCVGFKDDTVPYYAAMDIFAMPSRREGFGMTLIEASAMKLPVIGSRIVGCVDAVDDGLTGILVEVDNKDQLVMAMKQMIKSPELRRKFGCQGDKRTNELFNTHRLVKEHLELYDFLRKDIGHNKL